MPDYERIDISDILNKDNISDEEFETIFRQTGVSSEGAKAMLKNGDKKTLIELNELYFKKPEIGREYIAYPITVEERNINQSTPMVPLKKGDVLISFNTHTLDWRHGHSAIVLDNRGTLLEHTSIGNNSCTSYARFWGKYPGFMVLRYFDEKVAAMAADYASEHLIDIDYNFFAGIIKKDKSDEEKPSSSHCSHIVWQAYKAVGVDIDENGGQIVLPKDIAKSEELKLIQVYGINKEKYKK